MVEPARNGPATKRKFEDIATDVKRRHGEFGDLLVELSVTVRDDGRATLEAIRVDARGAREAAESVDRRAAEISSHAGEVAKANSELATKAEHLDSQATLAGQEAQKASAAANEVKGLLSNLKITVKNGDETKELVGPEALAYLGDRITKLPEMVRAVVDVALKTVVEVDGEPKTLTGAELFQHMLTEIGNARRAAASALKAAEESAADARKAAEQVAAATDAIEGQRDADSNLLRDGDALVKRAEAAASDANAVANKLRSTLEDAFGMVDEKLKTLLGVLSGKISAADAEEIVNEPSFTVEGD